MQNEESVHIPLAADGHEDLPARMLRELMQVHEVVDNLPLKDDRFEVLLSHSWAVLNMAREFVVARETGFVWGQAHRLPRRVHERVGGLPAAHLVPSALRFFRFYAARRSSQHAPPSRVSRERARHTCWARPGHRVSESTSAPELTSVVHP